MRRDIGDGSWWQCGICRGRIGARRIRLYQVAGRRWQVQPTFRVRAEFETIAVSKSVTGPAQGIDAGLVDRVIPPQCPRTC